MGNSYLQALEEKNEQLCYEAVKYIDFCYIKLMEHEHNVDELEYITLTLESLCKGLKIIASNSNFHSTFLK